MLPIKGKYPGKSKSRFLNVSFFNTIIISSKTSIKVVICTQSSTPQFRLEISKLRTLRKILFSSKSNILNALIQQTHEASGSMFHTTE